ncbi:GTP cyclohydrolase I FolE [Collinsella sp. AGMB00827]|uniref:GTP cyclohydrolase 1 n=1 Tax=Collinsella ureilytica TaxID=2869515 RepID=A0ABS7MIU6_9ACTN|nr:GTP cyclohydrolase I FolE [Collinsella urealyticum]MBY4797016.1 GTP cyclohydrolase I FolE [Collinsella urealyticum]
MVDQEKVERATRLLLEGIGEDPTRPGLIETPERVARMYTELLAGMNSDASEYLVRTFPVGANDLVIESHIPFYSLCEHHLLPFFGTVSIGYVSNKKVAGLSKLARTVETFARRLQLQERLTAEIADAVMQHLTPQGAIVCIEAEHMCMAMRGVQKPGAITSTLARRGIFETDRDLEQRFFAMLNQRHS